MVEQERLHEAVQPAGHANSTADCGCGYDKNRFSNKRDPYFAIGCIVEFCTGSSKRGRKRRSKTQRAGKIVAISPQTISVHTLLVGPGEDIHVEAPFEQFRLFRGNESDLLERLLSVCHGTVNVTSAAPFRFRGALVQGPCQLDCGDLILSNMDICAEPPRVKPQEQQGESLCKREEGKRKRGAEPLNGQAPKKGKITEFFSIANKAAALV